MAHLVPEVATPLTLFGLNKKSKTALKNKLSVKFLIIDELSMISSDLLIFIDQRFEDIFRIIPEKAFSYQLTFFNYI